MVTPVLITMDRPHTTGRAVALVALILLIGGVVYIAAQKRGSEPVLPGEMVHEPQMQMYSSDEYGISFTYPDTYQLTERDTGTPQRNRHTITLVKKSDLANIPVGGEGPTAINIDVFQNDLDRQAIRDFVTGSNDSNFKLSPDGRISSTTVAGSGALSYRADGLYASDNVVWEHESRIFMASGQYMTAEDEIRVDFQNLLASIQLQ